MSKMELKEQLQENLLAYFDGIIPITSKHDDVMNGMCDIIIKTVENGI